MGAGGEIGIYKGTGDVVSTTMTGTLDFSNSKKLDLYNELKISYDNERRSKKKNEKAYLGIDIIYTDNNSCTDVSILPKEILENPLNEIPDNLEDDR